MHNILSIFVQFEIGSSGKFGARKFKCVYSSRPLEPVLSCFRLIIVSQKTVIHISILPKKVIKQISRKYYPQTQGMSQVFKLVKFLLKCEKIKNIRIECARHIFFTIKEKNV